MLIKTYSTEVLDNYFFNTCRIIISLMALVSVVSIFRNWNPLIAIPTLAIFITPLVFISWPRFNNNVFSVLLIFFLLLFIYTPLTYLSIKGEDYIYGWGLISVPFSQDVYIERYIINLYFLFFCLFSSFLGLSIISTKFKPLKTEMNIRSYGSGPLILLGIIAMSFLINDILVSLAAKAAREAGSEGLLKFLFFDHAYMFIAGIAIMGVNGTNLRSQSAQKKAILFIAFAFTAIATMAGSKAGFLGVFFFFFLVSYSYIRTRPDSLILFPSIPLIISVVVLAPILYFTMFFYRIGLTTSFDFDILMILSLIDANSITILTDEIFYRLSAGGLDRFMLISNSFLSAESSSYGAQEYLPYIFKNFINLVLPGTPFQEAYAPSSQMFPQVIALESMNGDVTASYLMHSINSQAFTIFGVMTIISGWFAPLALFMYNIFLCLVYSLIKNLFIRMTIIYFYFGALSSFGFEVAAGYAYHVIICFFFMYFLLVFFSKIKLGIKSNNSSKL